MSEFGVVSPVASLVDASGPAPVSGEEAELHEQQKAPRSETRIT
jgi:hypothetical protein